jgi:hypothetical protein
MATILRIPSTGKTSYQARLPVAHDPDVRAKPRSSSPRATNGTPSRDEADKALGPLEAAAHPLRFSPIRCLPVCRRVSPSYYCKRHLRSVCSQLPIGSEKSRAKVRSDSSQTTQGSLVFSEPRNASRRTINLPQRAVEALRIHHKHQLKEKELPDTLAEEEGASEDDHQRPDDSG